jgi:putative ABC transport system permease protein
MSWWSRIANVFYEDRLNREVDEELESHIAEAVERGCTPDEARRTFGSTLRQREQSRDIRLLPWLDSLRADAVFGWRQLMKRKVTSAAAILSLALATGACTSAFRLIDALLLRPLPIAGAERLYSCFNLSNLSGGPPLVLDGYEYPMFQQMRAAAKGQAELIAVSYAERTDLTYASDQEMEKAFVQKVSGWMFRSFGLRPALGRLLTEQDDLTPGAHPYVVLSYDYWTRRFGHDPKVLGRTFRMGDELYQIVGVSGEGFTGVETGTATDIFVPTMMDRRVTGADNSWIRILVQLKPGVAVESVRDRLQIPYREFRKEVAKRRFAGMSRDRIERFLSESLMLAPAAAGVSRMQRDYRRPLVALGVLVALVLLIACANVANLLTAQAATRAREMALRVSIGAGRWRLVQLMLVESAWLAILAGAIGGVFAWWSAPFIVARINPPDNPARLALPADWRVLGFALLLTLAVTLLFGLAPALRASSVKPAGALKGGEDPHSRRRLMRGSIAVQVAFCFLVLFVAGLFVATFDRLSSQPTGFSSARILLLDATAVSAQPPVYWDQVAQHLRTVPGVETVALAGWALLKGDATIGSISVNGGPPSADIAYFIDVSPGWIDTMKIPLIAGRDFRAGDSAFWAWWGGHASPSTPAGVAIVNEAFVRQYFNGENPLGKYFEKTDGRCRFQIVGLVRNARYRDLRGPILPVAYIPFQWVDDKGAPQPKRWGTFIVRTRGRNPMALASVLRREVPRARAEFRVSNIQTQEALNQSHTIRERLLAKLALFFAIVALLLAGVGLYGVLDYSVLQRRREIGIRMAIGAPAASIARLVTVEVFTMVLAGAVAGVALGMASVRYIESLLYQVKAGDPAMLAVPSLTILAAAVLAALPAVFRAVRIDPVAMLRVE